MSRAPFRRRPARARSALRPAPNASRCPAGRSDSRRAPACCLQARRRCRTGWSMRARPAELTRRRRHSLRRPPSTMTVDGRLFSSFAHSGFAQQLRRGHELSGTLQPLTLRRQISRSGREAQARPTGSRLLRRRSGAGAAGAAGVGSSSGSRRSRSSLALPQVDGRRWRRRLVLSAVVPGAAALSCAAAGRRDRQSACEHQAM